MQTPSIARPLFQKTMPRILLLTSQFFLIGELLAACQRLGVEHLLIDLGTKEMDRDTFVSQMTTAILDFKPDFVLTVNHLGVDQEGVLISLLEKYNLPLASWFVDNPYLILGDYPRIGEEQTVLFTWDSDTVSPLKLDGFEHVFYLPLAADTTRLKPHREEPVQQWKAPLSFVGNSMLNKTLKRLEAAQPSQRLVDSGLRVAQEFSESEEPHAGKFLTTHFPELCSDFAALGTRHRQQAFETFITWQATLLYRLDCILRLMDYNPLIVGDAGWKILLENQTGWRYHSELSYYEDLPDFYPLSDVNFNCTSQQMKGAVNQRVFDVPCCGAFLLTDYRRQIEDLFEPEKEIVFYNHPDQIPDLLEVYLHAPEKRKQVADAARKRILAEHTYDHRILSLIDSMRHTFA